MLPGFNSRCWVKAANPALRRQSGVACTVPHPLGPLTVALRRDGDALEGEVVLPDGLTGTFHWGDHRLPLKPGRQTVSLAR